MNTTAAICVWLDKTSDPENPSWIVSKDELDDRWRAVTTTTLDTFDADDYDAAIESAEKEAIRWILPLYENPESGPATCIQSQSVVAMAAALDARGDVFTGGDVWDVASDWAENFDDANEAAEWMDAGFWDAAAASTVRALGLTADQAAARAKELIDACEDAASEYTDGDPIYSICNNDTPAEILLTVPSED